MMLLFLGKSIQELRGEDGRMRLLSYSTSSFGVAQRLLVSSMLLFADTF
jgi:hypothetical protein